VRVIFDPKLHIQHPPGYRLALHYWQSVNGSDAWIKLLPVISGTVLIAAMWHLAVLLWPARPRIAAYSAWLTAASPFLVHVSRDVTTYAWTSLWITLTMLAL